MAETLTELVAKISADATELKKGLTDAEGKTEQSSKKMAESLKKVGIAMAAAGAAVTAAMGLMGKAAIDEEINIKRLATTMKNAGTSYDDVRDSLEALISTTQRKTGVADNEQRDILNRLILVTNDYGKALELLPTVLDLAAAGEMDATTAATYLGKAYLELEEGAEEVTVRFGQASLQFKSMEDIQNRVAGSAEALANPLSVLKASIGDVAETIGAFLVPSIKELVDKVVNIAIKIQEWAGEHPELAKNLTMVTTAVGLLLLAVGGIILILPSLISGFAALTTVIGITSAFIMTTLIPAIVAAITASWAWVVAQLAAIAASGLGIPIAIAAAAAIGILTTGIILLIKNQKEQLEQTLQITEATSTATDVTKDLANAIQGTKQAIGYARWTADGYTYSMQLFTQAEIDAAKASGKKVEVLKTQSDVMEDNTTKAIDYTKAIDDASASVTNLKDVIDSTMPAAIRLPKAEAIFPEMGEIGTIPFSELTKAQRTAGIQAGGHFWAPTEADKRALEKFMTPHLQHGGIITQPTMAMIGEAGPEAVIPLSEAMGGITINFTQPVFFDREDTMNKFVDMIRKGIQRQDRLRFGGAYSGG